MTKLPTDTEALEYYLNPDIPAPKTEAEKALYLRGKALHKGLGPDEMADLGEPVTATLQSDYASHWTGKGEPPTVGVTVTTTLGQDGQLAGEVVGYFFRDGFVGIRMKDAAGDFFDAFGAEIREEIHKGGAPMKCQDCGATKGVSSGFCPYADYIYDDPYVEVELCESCFGNRADDI